jgi:hypothetical protein
MGGGRGRGGRPQKHTKIPVARLVAGCGFQAEGLCALVATHRIITKPANGGPRAEQLADHGERFELVLNMEGR